MQLTPCYTIVRSIRVIVSQKNCAQLNDKFARTYERSFKARQGLLLFQIPQLYGYVPISRARMRIISGVKYIDIYN